MPTDAGPVQGNGNRARSGVAWKDAETHHAWPWAVLVLVLVTVPFIIAVQATEGDALQIASSVAWLHFALLMLATGGALLARWRILDEVTSGWLAACLLTIGLTLMPFALDAAITHTSGTPTIGWPQLLCTLLVVSFLRASKAGIRPGGLIHPMLIGTLCGSILALLQAFAPVAIAQPPHLVARPLLLVGCLFVIRQILQVEGMSTTQKRLAAAGFGVAVAWHHLIPFEMFGPVATQVTILMLSAACSTLMLTAAVLTLRQAIALHDRRVVELADRATRAEQDASADEELLHELRSAIAGISSVSQLLERNRDQLPGKQADGLHRMLASETSRLETMLRPGERGMWSSQPALFDLDTVIEPLVLGLSSQGVEIDHRRSGLAVHGHPHGLAEVVQALLSNANRHAPTAQVTITSELADDHVVIRIADNGPGIPPEVRPRLFRRSAKGIGSPGQGLGLYIAQRTIRDQGGDLSLEETGPGTVFRLRLPQMSQP